MTMAVPVASSVRTSFTLAGCSAFATSSAGFSDHGTTSIFSPRSSLTTMRTREPLGPTHGAHGIHPWFVRDHRDLRAVAGFTRHALDLDDALFDLRHLHREERLSRPGCERDTTICGPFVPLRTSVM